MRPIHALAATLLLGACIQRGYPLATSGAVEVSVDVSGPLFAAGQLDAGGDAVLPRQTPFETGVSLNLTENGQPAYSAYVDVRVSPPDALKLLSDPDEKSPTCTANGGAFRCMATSSGFARFIARSTGVWSGAAKLEIVWGGNTPKEQPITILPAGLPQDATNFELVVGGIGGTDHVTATYLGLQCTSGPVPDDLGSKWTPGAIRARQAYVIATAPPAQPTVVANAPVVIESQSAESALSLKPDCLERHPRLRVLLGASGETDPFYLCFSDAGGAIRYAVTSGQKTVDPEPQITVESEPRLLRVRAVQSTLTTGIIPVDVFEVSAYDAERRRIAVPVDVRVDDDKVLGLAVASITLADESSQATVIQAIPLKAGTAALHATPRLLDMPDCASPPVTVADPPPTP